MKKLQKIYHQTNAIIIAHGHEGEIPTQTIHGILKLSTLFNIVALIDKHKVGQDTSEIYPWATKKVPIYANVREAMVHSPKVAILIDDPLKTPGLTTCIRNGMDIINSSIYYLKDISKLVKLAKKQKTNLFDLRKERTVWKNKLGKIAKIKAKVVFVTSTDHVLGNHTVALELANEAKRRGIKAAFAATGPTGLMLGCDAGIVFERLRTNFSSHAVEKLITQLNYERFELIFLEGQASLLHHYASTVVTLLHASNPHAIVLMHDPSRKYLLGYTDTEFFQVLPLQRNIDIIESMYLEGGTKYKVVAVSTWGEDNAEQVKKMTNLPVANGFKEDGPGIIMDAVLQHLKDTYKWIPSNQKSTDMPMVITSEAATQ